MVLARKITEPKRPAAGRFDLTGAVLSAAGLSFIVLGLPMSVPQLVLAADGRRRWC
jgi:hypothetical protein